MAGVIPFDQRDGVIWHDGKLVPWKDAKTHVLTHGLHYGSCVFEGQRMYNGTIYKLKEHTERLFKSAEILDFEARLLADGRTASVGTDHEIGTDFERAAGVLGSQADHRVAVP